MKTWIRVAAWGAAALAVLFVAAAVAVPLLVDADTFRPRIEARLTEALGRPVKLGAVRLTLWTGLAVRADRLEIGGSPSLVAQRARVGIALLPLLRREVQPRWASVDAATVGGPKGPLLEAVSVRCRITPDASRTSRVRGRLEGVAAALREKPLVTIDFDAATGADTLEVASFVARVGANVVEARASVSGLAAKAPRGRVSGSARAGGVTVTDIEAPFAFEDGVLRIEGATFHLHGGTGRVDAGLRLQTKTVPFTLRGTLEGVDVESLAAAMFPASAPVVEGQASASLDLAGALDVPAIAPELKGTARLAAAKGALRSVGLMKQAAQILEMAGGRGLGKDETPFESVSGTFTVAASQAKTSDLAFRSETLDLDGGGTVGLDGGLGLDVVSSFSKEASAELVRKTPQLKFRVGGDGRLTVPMKIRGTLQAPAVQIDLDRVLEEGLKQKIQDKAKKSWLKKLLGRN